MMVAATSRTAPKGVPLGRPLDMALVSFRDAQAGIFGHAKPIAIHAPSSWV
jgi:hypothetical protein